MENFHLRFRPTTSTIPENKCFAIYCCSPEEKEKPNQNKTNNPPHSQQVRASHPQNCQNSSLSHKFWPSQVFKILYHGYYVNTLSWDMLQIWAEVPQTPQLMSTFSNCNKNILQNKCRTVIKSYDPGLKNLIFLGLQQKSSLGHYSMMATCVSLVMHSSLYSPWRQQSLASCAGGAQSQTLHQLFPLLNVKDN